jgi:hypothetical protein
MRHPQLTDHEGLKCLLVCDQSDQATKYHEHRKDLEQHLRRALVHTPPRDIEDLV